VPNFVLIGIFWLTWATKKTNLKYRLSYCEYFSKKVIDNVLAILLGYEYHDTNTFQWPTMLKRWLKALNQACISVSRLGQLWSTPSTSGSHYRKAHNMAGVGATFWPGLAYDTIEVAVSIPLRICRPCIVLAWCGFQCQADMFQKVTLLLKTVNLHLHLLYG